MTPPSGWAGPINAWTFSLLQGYYFYQCKNKTLKDRREDKKPKQILLWGICYLIVLGTPSVSWIGHWFLVFKCYPWFWEGEFKQLWKYIKGFWYQDSFGTLLRNFRKKVQQGINNSETLGYDIPPKRSQVHEKLQNFLIIKRLFFLAINTHCRDARILQPFAADLWSCNPKFIFLRISYWIEWDLISSKHI